MTLEEAIEGSCGDTIQEKVMEAGQVIGTKHHRVTVNKEIIGHAGENKLLGGDSSFTYTKKRSDSVLLIEGALHCYIGYTNDAAGVWAGGAAMLKCGGSFITPSSAYGFCRRSVGTSDTERMMGYAINSGEAVGVPAGDVVISILWRPCAGQQDDEGTKLNTHGDGYIKVTEIVNG